MASIFLLITAFIMGCVPAMAGDRIVVPGEDTSAVLHNPDMGWVLYENFPLDSRPNGSGTMNTLPGETFPACDSVAVMFAWSDVEKSQGVYDWARVDAACDYWLNYGKSLQLRMSTEPLFGWSRLKPAGGLGIPEWLLAAIPAAEKSKRTASDGNFGWHVDARNPVYQKHLRAFLQETHSHFTGKRRPTLIDLRGFGRWGEWHTGYPYSSLADKREALAAVLDIWCGAFPDRMLALSYSHDPDGPDELHAGTGKKPDPAYTADYQDYLRFSAFDLALKHPNITLRRDGAGGAVSPNQRKLCEYVYRDLRRAPQSSEFVSGYGSTMRGGKDHLKWAVNDALSLHPNYINLMGYGSKDAFHFMRDCPDLIDHGLRGMGYRLVPLKAGFPTRIVSGGKFVLKLQWTNRAAGRALRDYTLRVRIASDQGKTFLAEIETPVLPTSQWLQDDIHITRTGVAFPKLPGIGRAELQISLYDPLTKRAIQMPLAGRTDDGFYTIGTVDAAS